MNKLDREFHQAMTGIYGRARDEIGYIATYFIQMVSELGGVQAAKTLVSRPPSDGFTALWQHDRLDLSVEAHVILPRFTPLFTPDERQRAAQRLVEYGFNVDRWITQAESDEGGRG